MFNYTVDSLITYELFNSKDVYFSSKYCELLVYDWSEGGEIEIVVEDIERIEFVEPNSTHSKFKDWCQQLEEDWAILRYQYVDN